MRRLNYRHSICLILRICVVFFCLYDRTVYQSQLGKVCDKTNTLTGFTPLNFRNDTMHFLAFAPKLQYKYCRVRVCQSEDSSEDVMSPRDVPKVMNIKHQFNVIMFSMITSDGKVIPTFCD